MRVRKLIGPAVEALVVLGVLSLLVGSFLGQPLLLSYVETGSMSPTLNPGDGFIAVPTQIAGPVEEGDVIAYRAEELHGGGLVTHRVVDQTDRGFRTQGDANAVPDQAGIEPPVKRPQIVAVALQVDGSVVCIPWIGHVATGIQEGVQSANRWVATTFGIRLGGTSGGVSLLLAVLGGFYLIDAFRDTDEPPESEERASETDTWTYLIIGVAVVVLATTAGMVLPAGTTQYDVISAETDSSRSTVILHGTTEPRDITLTNSGIVPVVVFLEDGDEGISTPSDGIHVPSRGEATARIALSAPAEIGHYRRYLVTHRYFAVLPPSTLRVLYGIHPWVPVVVIDLMVGGVALLLGWLTLGFDRDGFRDRLREVSNTTNLLRLIKRLLQ